MRPGLVFALAAFVLGCAPAEDPRFVSEATVRERLAARAELTLRDAASFRACFSDLTRPDDEGLAGFVVGSVGAAKDSLAIEVDENGDRAIVRLGHDAAAPRLVLRHQPDGWHVVLAESVPAEVRAQLRAIHRRAEARLRLGT